MATERCRRRALAKFAFLGVVLAFLLLFLAQGQAAHAANFAVNSTADATDASPGDGVCATAAGVCTLRAAIQEANALPGPDTITLPAGTYALTISGAGEDAAATGDLDITADLTINGAGAATTIVDGGGLDRVLHITATVFTATVTISGVMIQNGLAGLGGGIFNLGTLTLNGSTVSGNTVSQFGGGILNSGTTALTNSTVSANSAGEAGGIGNSGGTLTLTNSTVSGNSAVGGLGGGGIVNSGGTVTLTTSAVSGNTGNFSGGIGNFGTMTVTSSTVSGNSAASGGGGIFSQGTLTLTNSTISGNSAGFGGGIRNAQGTVTLNNSTVSDNTASGIAIATSATASLKNAIVANNTAGDCLADGGTITSAGHNLDSDGTCGLTGTGDLSGVNPLLGPLQNNGGPTQTHALLAGSPAIDAGSPDCPPPASDQRGVARPQGAACDIGAFEVIQLIEVAIDIKPGSFPNSINLKSKERIPVAILTTGTFDAATVDSTTVRFGATGTEAAPVHSALADVDGDGDTDLIVHFKTQATGIQCGDTSASLTGKTFGGQMIQGSDSIKTVGCK